MSFLSSLLGLFARPRSRVVQRDPRLLLPVTIWDAAGLHHVISAVLLYPDAHARAVNLLDLGFHFAVSPLGDTRYSVRLVTPEQDAIAFRTCSKTAHALAWAVENLIQSVDTDGNVL